jgi:hypothetical protein
MTLGWVRMKGEHIHDRELRRLQGQEGLQKVKRIVAVAGWYGDSSIERRHQMS